MELSKESKSKIVEKLRMEEASYIAVFGSFARGEADEQSDIDILIEFSEPKSLVEVARIERELEEQLGREIDLVTEQSLSPYIRERMGDAEVLMA